MQEKLENGFFFQRIVFYGLHLKVISLRSSANEWMPLQKEFDSIVCDAAR